MSKIKAKMVVDYLLNMITMGIVADEEIKDVTNTIWYILEASDMVEEYLSELERLKAQLFIAPAHNINIILCAVWSE